MRERIRVFLGIGIEDYRKEVICKQIWILFVISVLLFAVSASYVVSVSAKIINNELSPRNVIPMYAAMCVVCLLSMVFVPILRRPSRFDQTWRILEIWAYAMLTTLPVWAVWVLNETHDNQGYINEIHWAICAVIFGCVMCIVPIYSHVVLLGTTIALIHISEVPAVQQGNYIVLTLAIMWAGAIRFRDSYNAFENNKSKNMFLARVTHEIRTPIGAINGTNELILRECEDEQIRSYATDIKHSGTILLELVNDILDVSRLEANKLTISADEYSLRELVYDVERIIYFKAESNGLKLNTHVEEALPDHLYGDDIRVKQVLINLLSNAVKYTEKGTVELNVRGVVEGNLVKLAFYVSDTGTGIKPEDLKKLKNGFYRIENKRNRKIEGTGLGLYIVDHLLAAMDGHLEIESDYGVGSIFIAHLEQKIIDETEDQNEKSNSSERYVPLITAPDAKVLIVDDTPINLKLISALLKETRIQIDAVKSAEEMFDLLEENLYDLIFLDDIMPEMSGCDAMVRLKSKPNYPGIPVVALTANERSDGYTYYASFGFSGYLSKPVSPKKLEETLVKYIPKEKIISLQGTEEIS